MIYLQKPISIRQSQHLIKMLTIIYDLGLISELTLADTSIHWDEHIRDLQRYSWEAPPKEWWTE